MRGKPTNPLTMKAIRLLDGNMEPLEIGQVLRLPKRTVYDLLKRVREEVAREEAERQRVQRVQAGEQARREQERLDRQRWEAEVLSKIQQEVEQVRGAGQMGCWRTAV